MLCNKYMKRNAAAYNERIQENSFVTYLKTSDTYLWILEYLWHVSANKKGIINFDTDKNV